MKFLYLVSIVSLYYSLVFNTVSGQRRHPGEFHNYFRAPNWSSYFPGHARNWWSTVSNPFRQQGPPFSFIHENSYTLQNPVTHYPVHQPYKNNFRPSEYRNNPGWGWQKGPVHPQVHSVPTSHPPYGWTTIEIPKDMCMEIIDLNITKPSDIKDGWVILQAISKERRQEVDKFTLLNPNLILVPPTPRSVVSGQPIPYNISSIIQITADPNGENLQETELTNITLIEGSSDVSTIPTDSGERLEASLILYEPQSFSPPLRGKDDPKKFFSDGLKYSVGNRSAGLTYSPIQNFFREDVLFMRDLFNRLQDLDGNQNSRIADGVSSEESWVDVENLVGRVERKFIAEPDHSEQTVLDAEFNFGLPVVYFQFENSSELTNAWTEKRKSEGRTFDRGSLVVRNFKNPQTYQENVNENLRRKLEVYRKFGRDTFIRTERKIQEDYKFSQYLICQSRDSNGNCGECPLDPIAGGFTSAYFKPKRYMNP